MKHQATSMAQLLWLLLTLALLVLFHLAPPLAAASVSHIVSTPTPAPWSLPGCPSKCGDVEIPYPFGIGSMCAWPGSLDFNLTCYDSNKDPKPYIGNIEIQSISVQTGEMHVFTPVAYRCFNSSNTVEYGGNINWNLTGSSTFLISPTKNVFTAIGCYTLAFLEGGDDWKYFTGCLSSCVSLNDSAQDGSPCTGLGCCQMSIPAKLSNIEVNWGNDNNSFNAAWEYSPCSYGFVAEKGWYNFSRLDLSGRENDSFISRVGESTVPLALDWAITNNGPCQDGASGKPTAPACVSRNSECVSAAQGDGYLCNCSNGYQGNPYITNGCQDIDECALRESNPAIYEERYYCARHSKCHNTPGSYECKCRRRYKGDGKSEKGCRLIFPGYAVAVVATFVALLILVVLIWFVHKDHKQRMRRGFFDRNGGKLLKVVDIKIYTEGELEKMTNNYGNIIGKGHFGNVFMGTTHDNKQVAVKRAIRADGNKPPEGGEFVDEILFQFQMKHDNLVRLVGCCLETSAPMLVFEFIPKGSLSNVLHGASNRRAVSLLQRLDIAIGSAQALNYMHSHGHQKRIHGDVKSANILLDDDLSPKVSDFGSSKVVCSKSRYVRLVASDMNYVDPVYMKTSRFTDKSDVYSFGVVLLELITRKAARYDGNNSLPIDFAKSCKVEGNGRKMYDRDILDEGDAISHVYTECLDSIGALAVSCLKEDVDERPAMTEVLEELKRVKAIASGADSYSVLVAG